jgi:hypothetical protein
MKQGLSLSVWHQPGDVFKAKDGKNVSICRSEDGGKTWGEEIVIAEMRGITREAGRAKKYGVVLNPSLPTDFQTGEVHDGPDGGAGYEFGESAFCWFISPHWDAGKKMFRLWYMASKRPGSGLAYAESKDGMIWTKPLVSRNGKSNLVIVNPGGGLDGINVLIDSSLPFGHAEKYKVAYFSYGGDSR